MLEKKLYSRSEAATILGVKKNTLAVWAVNHRYNLPYVKIGSRAMYRAEDLENFIENNLVVIPISEYQELWGN